MNDIDKIRRETEKVFVEAGIKDADVSYITEKFINECERSSEANPENLNQLAQGDEVEATGNKLWNVAFLGPKYWGNILSAGQCGGTWVLSGYWTQKRLVSRCPNNGSYIWFVG